MQCPILPAGSASGLPIQRRVFVARPLREGEDLSNARAVAPPLASGGVSPVRAGGLTSAATDMNSLGISQRPDTAAFAAAAGGSK